MRGELRDEAYTEMRALEDEHWWFRGRRAVVAPLVQRAEDGAPGPWIDLGCGTGGTLAWRGIGAAVGVDSNARALELARERTPRPALARADAEALPFAAGSFARATALDVLEHFEDDGAVAGELARVLRPGGQLIASVPAYPRMWSPHDEALGHQRRYRRGELERLLAIAGFEIAERRSFNFVMLPPIAAVRAVKRMRAGASAEPPTTDFFRVPGWLDRALALPFLFERALQAVAPVPFGLSWFVRAVRP